MTLQFKADLWSGLLSELERRSARRVESGAFLLGTRDGGVRSIERCVYYDDLFGDALRPTHIYLPSDAYQALWAICRETGSRVVADVHTHPGGATQSRTDKLNPMVPEIGHVAMILPNFADQPISMASIGLYEYLGSFQWERIPGPLVAKTLKIDGRS